MTQTDPITSRNLSLIADADLSTGIAHVEMTIRLQQAKAAKYASIARRMRDEDEGAEEFNAAAYPSENAARLARINMVWLLLLTGERNRRAA